MRKTKFLVSIFFTILILFFVMYNNTTIVRALPTINIDELDGNDFENPFIHYEETDLTIPNWQIRVTDNIRSYNETVNRLEPTKDGKRKTDKLEGFYVGPSNQTDTFTSYIGKKASSDALMLLSQSYTGMDINQKYIFRIEIAGNAVVIMNVYDGGNVSGGKEVLLATESINTTEEVQNIEMEFKSTKPNFTLSFRHLASPNKETYINIKGVAFIEKVSYIKQQLTKSLTRYVNDNKDFVLDDNVLDLIDNGANKLTQDMEKDAIDLIYNNTLKDIHYYLMTKDLKEYNNSFTPSILFDDTLFEHLKDDLTIDDYNSNYLIAKEILLNTYKDKMHNELIDYANNLDPNFSLNDYLISIIENSKSKLDNNTDYKSLVDAAKKLIDDEYKLFVARNTIKSNLDNLLNNYPSELYSDVNYQEILNIIENAKTQVKNTTGLEELNRFDINDVIDLLDKVKTLQMELDEAKANLKEKILKNYPNENYSSDINQKIEDLIDQELDTMLDITQVEDFDFENSELKIKIDEMIAFEEAKKQLEEEILAKYPEDKYSDSNNQLIKDKIQDALDELLDFSDVKDFDFANSELKKDLDNIKNKEQELAEAKKEIEDEILSKYPEENYSDLNNQLIKDKIQEVLDGLTDIEAVNDFDFDNSDLKDELDSIKTK